MANLIMASNSEKPWFDDAEPEDVKFLRESIEKVKAAIKNGLNFDEAVGILSFPDAGTKAGVLDDITKVLIAEMHFNGGKTLEEMAESLRIPLARLAKAKAEMIQDVEAAAIEAYHDSMGRKGNA